MIRAGRRLAVAVVCAASALPVAPAAATAPTVEVLPVDFTVVAGPGETLPTGGTNPCPLAIAFHNAGTFGFQTLSDRDGTAVRQLIRSARFTETYSANGRSLSTVSPAPAASTSRAARSASAATCATSPSPASGSSCPGRPRRDQQQRQPRELLGTRHPRRRGLLRGAVGVIPRVRAPAAARAAPTRRPAGGAAPSRRARRAERAQLRRAAGAEAAPALRGDSARRPGASLATPGSRVGQRMRASPLPLRRRPIGTRTISAATTRSSRPCLDAA